jgi:Flp pilus assembly protein TadG
MGWEYVRTRTIRGRENGASLIEFALLMPLLILLILGIVEFGWLFSQNNDVKHGAREGARSAAVNLGDNSVLLARTCDSMDLASNIVTVQFTDSAGGNIGEAASVSVVATPTSLSGLGLIEALMPTTLTSTIEFRLEQPSSSWGSFGPVSC